MAVAQMTQPPFVGMSVPRVSVPVLPTSSNSSDPSSNAFDNLFPALIQCFGLIFTGYFAGRINLLTQSQGRGISTFVGSFAMPAMLFKSMVELHFADVDWYFLLDIFLAKSAVFAATACLTLLLVRPTHTGKMGIYSIFTTQSHDFALGIPIVQALYATSHPEYEKYLYLIAPISVAFLNPLGFLLLEIQRWRDARRLAAAPSTMPPPANTNSTTSEAAAAAAAAVVSPRTCRARSLGHLLARVLTNPIVFMTLFGIIGNFALNRTIPTPIDSFLTVLKQAFPATALFCLGLSMVGRLTSQPGGATACLTPALLIAAKMLVSPFLIRELVATTHWGNSTSRESLSTYGFLYGAFPTAPSVFIYASQYNTQAEMMATGMVVSTFLSAPLMFISARMITLTSASQAEFSSLLNATSFDVSIVGLVACIWVLVVFVIHRRSGTLPHKMTTGLVLSQMLLSIGLILWHSLDMGVAWQHYLHFCIFFVGVLSSRFWLAGIAITLCLLRARSLCFVLRVHGWIALTCILLPLLLCAIVVGTVRQDPNAITPAFQYGRPQQILVAVALGATCIITIVSLVLQHRWRPTCPRSDGPRTPCPTAITDMSEDDDNIGALDTAPILGSSSIDQPRRITAAGRPHPAGRPRRVRRPSNRDGCQNCTGNGICSTSAPTGILSRNIEDLVPDISVRNPRQRGDSESSEREDSLHHANGVRSCTQETPCSDAQRSRCAQLLEGYNSFKLQLEEQDDEELAMLEERDEYQITRHVVLILLLLMSTFVGLFLTLWRLMDEAMLGLYIEIEFLDSVLAFGQGVFTFAVFGLDNQMVIEPLLNRFKHWLARRWPSLAARWRRRKVHVRELEDLPECARSTCAKFLQYHRDSCVKGVVRNRSQGQHAYRSVFTGRNLIDWLLEVGLASDRGEGLAYGRHLLTGGVIEHVHREHHFFDLPYFYQFTDSSGAAHPNGQPNSDSTILI